MLWKVVPKLETTIHYIASGLENSIYQAGFSHQARAKSVCMFDNLNSDWLGPDPQHELIAL